jgi:hypothetical protein
MISIFSAVSSATSRLAPHAAMPEFDPASGSE